MLATHYTGTLPNSCVSRGRSLISLASAVEPSRRVECTSPIGLWKACKNNVEETGMINCHLRDGAALAHCLSLLEGGGSPNAECSEVAVDAMITQMRRRYSKDSFLDRSFPTIAGVGPNGAVVHYRYELQ